MGFSCPIIANDDIQARRELKACVLKNCEVLEVELIKHNIFCG